MGEMLSGETDRAPGDYGFDPLNYKKQKDYSTVEVTHCRAAMLAFSGLVTQSAMFETGFPYAPHAVVSPRAPPPAPAPSSCRRPSCAAPRTVRTRATSRPT